MVWCKRKGGKRIKLWILIKRRGEEAPLAKAMNQEWERWHKFERSDVVWRRWQRTCRISGGVLRACWWNVVTNDEGLNRETVTIRKHLILCLEHLRAPERALSNLKMRNCPVRRPTPGQKKNAKATLIHCNLSVLVVILDRKIRYHE